MVVSLNSRLVSYEEEEKGFQERDFSPDVFERGVRRAVRSVGFSGGLGGG